MKLFFSEATLGFYSTEMHGESIPSDAVTITQQEHGELLLGQSQGSVIAADQYGRPFLKGPETPGIADRKAAAQALIDLSAGNARQRYVSAGQLIEEEYRQAHDSVKKWRLEGDPSNAVPDDVQSWADAAGITAEEAAADIEATAASWSAALSAIRFARLNGKAAVDAAEDLNAAHDMRAAAEPYIQQLDAIGP